MNKRKLQEIASIEKELVEEAEGRYGKYFEHAQYALDFATSYIKSASYEATFFIMFYSVVEKHLTLSALSAVRLHHVQATFDLRYAAEAAAWAAYAMANPDTAKFANNGEPTKALKAEMYQWLDKNYPNGSASIKRFKDSLNALSTHANIVDADRNFGGLTKETIETSFFDKAPEHHVNADLWSVANLVMGVLDLFYGVNRDYKVLVLQDDFHVRMQKLKSDNDHIKAEVLEVSQKLHD